MLSRQKRCSSLEEELADEPFHTHAARWRPVVESLRQAEQTDKAKGRHAHAEQRKRSYWSPWLWLK